MGDLHKRVFNSCEENYERRQDIGQDLQDKGGMQDDGVGRLSAEAFGDDLAEGQHQKGGQSGCDRRAVVFEDIQAEDGGKARTAEVDDVVADEDRGQDVVKAVGDP